MIGSTSSSVFFTKLNNTQLLKKLNKDYYFNKQSSSLPFVQCDYVNVVLAFVEIDIKRH